MAGDYSRDRPPARPVQGRPTGLKIVYLGADVPSNRTILESLGIKEVGVSYWRLVKRGLPKNRDYLFSNYFDPYMNIHVHPGIPGGTRLSEADMEAFVADYEIFVLNNLDRISSFMEVEIPDPEFRARQRVAAWDDAKNKFWVVAEASSEIDRLVESYSNIALPSDLLEDDVKLAAKVRSEEHTSELQSH